MPRPVAIVAGQGPAGAVNAVVDLSDPNAALHAGQLLLAAMQQATPGQPYTFTLLLGGLQDGS